MEATNLDDLVVLESLDPEGMLGHVAALPRQVSDAWALTRNLDLPVSHFCADKALVAGMGGSAIGGDLAVAVASGKSPIPIAVLRNYELPSYVDRQTLVIASSYSGNTEEVLSMAREAHGRGCPLVAITTGGELARLAGEWGVPAITFDYRSQPRAALGYMFVSLLGVLRAIGVVGSLESEIEEAVGLLESAGAELAPETPLAQNRAKQLATELHGRLPVVVGAGLLAPAARRWKTQFNENSKTWAYWEPLPEMNHNAMSGIHFPAWLAEQVTVLFLDAADMHPRNRLRLDLARQVFEGQDVRCHQVPVGGQGRLAQLLAAIQLGDYVSCYLAFLNGTDPTAIDDIVGLKQRMSQH